MDARIVKEFLAAAEVGEGDDAGEAKLRTVGTWPETNKT